MAMVDDPTFLVSHLRNSFITSDDTGMCELIMEGEEIHMRDQKNKKPPDEKTKSGTSDVGDVHDSILSHSYDILPDMDYGAHRRRSNTAQKLDRLKKEKRNHVKVRTVSWKDAPSDFKADEAGYLFEKKDVPVTKSEAVESIKKQFWLSQLMDIADTLSHNPFSEYMKYDGKTTVGVPVKKIDIYLTMAHPEDRAYPLPVIVVAAAKVQDLIGLICWHYNNEERDPKIQENIAAFSLHIAEDDGEVDADFPALDNKEPVSKFGFSKLALVERDVPVASKSSVVVTVNIPDRGFNKFLVESTNVCMKNILQRVVKRRKIKLRPGLNYNLEKQDEPGIAIDLDASLASMGTMEFCLVREHSSRGEPFHEIEESSNLAESLTSHQYKSYMVSMVHKIRSNSDVQLGVSGEKVEIDPVTGKSAATQIFRQKPVTYESDSIAACDMLEAKSSGKSSFRLTYLSSSNDYKHHIFETEHDTAMEIVQKINNILELRLSPTRKDFVTSRDRKVKKRESVKYS